MRNDDAIGFDEAQGHDSTALVYAIDETHRHLLPRLKQAHQTMMANLPKRKLADAWVVVITARAR